MTVITTFVLTLLLLAETAEAFMPLAFSPKKTRRVTSIASVETDEAISRLHNEYRELQDKLFDLLEKHKMTDASDAAEVMLEKAVDVKAFERLKQEETVEEAIKTRDQAEDDLARAHGLHQQAHDDAVFAEEQAAMVESIDAGYEDLERLRDMAVVHAAHHLEEDTLEREIDAEMEEMDAKIKEKEAIELFQQLKQSEKDLKETLKKLKESKNAKAMEEWAASEMPKHEVFLRKVKTHLIDHDPTKGEVAF